MSDIQVYKQQAQMISYDEIEKLAEAMVASGYFQDVKSVAQAIVKIKAGQEFGFGAFASMNGIYIINGRPAAGANLMASAIKSSGRYDYRVVQLDDKICELAFYENGKDIGHSIFTIEDARKAGTKNLDKFPRNMLFARAMSNGVRWYCPDVLNGNLVYTPEELGAEVDQDGNVLIIQNEQAPEIEPKEITETTQADEIKSKTQNKRPYGPEDLKKALVLTSTKVDPASENDRQQLGAILSQFTENDDERHKLQKFLFGAESLKDVEPRMITAALRWINPKYENGEYLIPKFVREELEAVYKQIIVENSIEDNIL
jgi:hypothetical protein